MKIRSNYVSNSSSSSYVLAYDKSFYGDLEQFFKKEYFGFETYVYDLKEPFVEDYINEGIKKAKEEGKEVIYFGLDNEYISIITLMKIINKNNGNDKLTVIYEQEE